MVNPPLSVKQKLVGYFVKDSKVNTSEFIENRGKMPSQYCIYNDECSGFNHSPLHHIEVLITGSRTFNNGCLLKSITM